MVCIPERMCASVGQQRGRFPHLSNRLMYLLTGSRATWKGATVLCLWTVTDGQNGASLGFLTLRFIYSK